MSWQLNMINLAHKLNGFYMYMHFSKLFNNIYFSKEIKTVIKYKEKPKPVSHKTHKNEK